MNFVQGCDLILDQLEFFVIPEKYALHRAFRKSARTKAIIACSVVGWAGHLYKFERDSLPIEDWYGLPEDAAFTPRSQGQAYPALGPAPPPFSQL